VRANSTENGIRRLDSLGFLCPRIDQNQVFETVLIDDANDAITAKKNVPGITENPLRYSDLRIGFQNRFDPPRTFRIEIPPACSIGDEKQRTVGRPFRLEYRFRCRAGDSAGIRNGSLRTEICRPQFRSIPGHLRMPPARPCQPSAVPTDAWKRIE